MVKIRVGDIDFEQCKIFGKGQKGRYILFPESFRLVLQAHLVGNAKNRYLFETTRFTPFTVRRVQQVVQAYRQKAGITRLVQKDLRSMQLLAFAAAYQRTTGFHLSRGPPVLKPDATAEANLIEKHLSKKKWTRLAGKQDYRAFR